MSEKRRREPTKTSGTKYWGNDFASKNRGDWKTFSTKLPQEVKDQLYGLKNKYGVSGVNEVILASIQLLINENLNEIDSLIDSILDKDKS